MNERMKDLYKEATAKTFANDFDARVLEAENFGEALIRACVALVEDDDNAFDILKHFGLEK